MSPESYMDLVSANSNLVFIAQCIISSFVIKGSRVSGGSDPLESQIMSGKDPDASQG